LNQFGASLGLSFEVLYGKGGGLTGPNQKDILGKKNGGVLSRPLPFRPELSERKRVDIRSSQGTNAQTTLGAQTRPKKGKGVRPGSVNEAYNMENSWKERGQDQKKETTGLRWEQGGRKAGGKVVGCSGGKKKKKGLTKLSSHQSRFTDRPQTLVAALHWDANSGTRTWGGQGPAQREKKKEMQRSRKCMDEKPWKGGVSYCLGAPVGGKLQRVHPPATRCTVRQSSSCSKVVKGEETGARGGEERFNTPLRKGQVGWCAHSPKGFGGVLVLGFCFDCGRSSGNQERKL